MAKQSGANSIAAAKISSGTVGTAASVGTTGTRLDGFTITPAENGEELSVSPIGSGDGMQAAAQRVNVSPTVALSGPLRYDGPEIAMIAQFFGSERKASWAGGMSVSSFLHNEVLNASYVTLAMQATSSEVMEFPSVAFRSLTLNFPQPAGYLTVDLDGLANEMKVSGTTNSYSNLESATVADEDRIVWEVGDEFWMNTQSGSALTSSDRVNIQSGTITLDKPQSHSREAKGSSGNAAPVADGDYILGATVSITLSALEAMTYFTAAQSGTEYKARFKKNSGGSAGTKAFWVDFPKLKIITDVQWALQNAGDNPVTIEFKALVPSSTPSGMGSRFPMLCVVNAQPTRYQTA